MEQHYPFAEMNAKEDPAQQAADSPPKPTESVLVASGNEVQIDVNQKLQGEISPERRDSDSKQEGLGQMIKNKLIGEHHVTDKEVAKAARKRDALLEKVRRAERKVAEASEKYERLASKKMQQSCQQQVNDYNMPGTPRGHSYNVTTEIH